MKWKNKISNKQELKQPLVLVQGKGMSGNTQWAFALIDAEKFMEFKIAESKGDYKLTDYGKVVAFGLGENPPQNVIDEMVEKYDADLEFEQKLFNQVKTEMDDFNQMLNQGIENKDNSSGN